MDHIIHNYFRRHKICNFKPVHGGLELSTLISFSYGSIITAPNIGRLRVVCAQRLAFSIDFIIISKFS